MGKTLLFIYFLLFASLAFSQQAKIDSLSQEFNNSKEDSIKIRLLAEIGVEAYSMNMVFAKQINDSLIRFAKGKNEKYLAQGYKVQGTFYLLDGDYENALKYYNQSLALFKKIKDRKNEAVLIGNLGTLNGRKGNAEESRKYYLQAIKINNEIKNYEGNIKPYINLAISVGKDNDFEKAIEYLIEALSIAEAVGSEQNLAFIHNQIAANYLKLDSYVKAETHLQNALEIAEKIEDSYALATIHNSLGYLYETRDENFEKAHFHYKNSLKYFTLINDNPGMINAYYNVGLQNIRFKAFKKAKNNFFAGLKLADSIQSLEDKIIGNLSLEHLFIEMGDFEKVNKYGEIAEADMANESRMVFKNHFYRLGVAYAENDLYKPAFENMQLYAILADSLFKKEGIDKISEITTKYQTEKKEKENLQLKAETTEQALVIERKKRETQLLGGTVAASILGIFALIFYARGRKRKMQVREQLNIARAKQLEHQKIGDELHNQKTKDLEIVINELESNGNHYAAQKVKMIKEDIRKLSKELSQVPFSEAEFDTQIITLLANYHSKNRKIVQTGLKDIDWKTVEDTIKRNLFIAIREGISNAYNHANAKNVTVAFRKRKKQLTVSISDDGQGFDETAVISGSGFRNMKMCINEINGNIKIESAEHKGTYILIQLAMA